MSSEKILMQNFVFTVLFGHYLDPPIHFHFHPTLGLDPALILTLRLRLFEPTKCASDA